MLTTSGSASGASVVEVVRLLVVEDVEVLRLVVVEDVEVVLVVVAVVVLV